MPVPLILEEAMRRSAVIWLDVAGAPQPRAVWHVWKEGVAYVLTGGLEQPWPGDPSAASAVVLVRSKEGSPQLIATWEATVAQVAPGSPAWNQIIPILQGKRLNQPSGDARVARWSRECALRSLTPTGLVSAQGCGMEISPRAT